MERWYGWDGKSELPVGSSERVKVKWRCGLLWEGVAPNFQWRPNRRGKKREFDVVMYHVPATNGPFGSPPPNKGTP